MLSKVVFASCLVAAIATSGGALSAECKSAFGMASSADSDAFKADPFSLLNTSPAGGGTMTRLTRELVLSNTDYADTILALAAAANGDQRLAMGAGLGQAAEACLKTQPEVAQRMQIAVLSGANPEIVTGFKGVTGDVETFAVAAPAAAPAPAPIGGQDAGLIGGGESSVKQGGPTQSGSFSASIASISSSRSSDGGSERPPVVTVPGPVMGQGLLGLVLVSLVGGLLYRRRSVRPA